MSNLCTVSIFNTEYYIPCDRVSDLQFLDGYLVNFSDSSITLRSVFHPENSQMYPYISCSSMSVCNIRSSQQINTPVTSNVSFTGDILSTVNPSFVIMFLLFILLGVKLLWKR